MMMQEGPLFHKPKSFLTARKLLYASIFISVLTILMRYFSIEWSNNVLTLLFIFGLFYLVMIVLIFQMSHCRKWARTALIILLVLSAIILPYTLWDFYTDNMLLAGLTGIHIILEIMAIVFLFSAETNEWFNSRSSEMLP